MKKNWKIFLAIGVLVAAGTAGYLFYRRQKKLLAQYTTKIVRISFPKVSGTNTIMNFTLRFGNKSDIEALLQALDVDVYLANTYVGRVQSNASAVIPARGQSDIPLTMTFAPKQALQNIVSLITGSLIARNLIYQLKGTATLKSSFVSVSIPVEYTGNVKDDLAAAPVLT